MKKIIIMLIFAFILIQGCIRILSTDFPDLRENYKFNRDGNGYLCWANYRGVSVVPAEIVSYDFNEKYMIVAQKCQEIRYSLSASSNLREAEKLYKESRKYYYWILNFENDSLYKRLYLKEFLIKREELGIPDSLKLVVELEF